MSQQLSHLETTLRAAFTPQQLKITDDSAQHAGHAGASAGGHYSVTMVAAAFDGLSLLARHRAVYATLGDLAQLRVHALALHLRAPGEV